MSQITTQPKFANVEPQRFENIDEYLRRKNQEANIQTGTLADAILLEGTVPAIVNLAQNNDYAIDPNYIGPFADKLTADRITDGLDSVYWDAFLGARNEQHAELIRERMLQVQGANQRLALSGGWTNFGLRAAASILDPVALTVDLLTAGVGRGALVASKATRARAFWRTGMFAATENSAIEFFVGAQDPTRGMDDVFLVGFGSLILGGGLSAALTRPTSTMTHAALIELAQRNGDSLSLGRALVVDAGKVTEAGKRVLKKSDIHKAELTPMMKAEVGRANILKFVELENLREGGLKGTAADSASVGPEDVVLSGAGEKHFASVNSESAFIQAREDIIAIIDDISADEAAELRAIPLKDFIRRTPDLTHNGPNLSFAGLNTKKSALKGIRPGFVAAKVGQSESESVRWAGNAFFHDPILREGGGPIRQTIGEWARTENGIRISEHLDNLKFNAKEHIKINGRRSGKEFSEMVTRAVRDENFPDTAPAHLKRQVAASAKHFEGIHGLARRYGLPGFENVPPNPNFVPRMLNPRLFRGAIDQFGFEATVGIVDNSIRLGKAGEGLTPKQSAKWARGYVRVASKLDKLGESQQSLIFAIDNADEIKKILISNADITDVEMENIIYDIVTRTKAGVEKRGREVAEEGVRVGHAKRRVQLDELAVDPNTGLALQDLLHNDIDYITTVYTRQMVGEIGMRQLYNDFATFAELAEIPDNIDQFVTAVIKKAKDEGVELTEESYDIKAFRLAYRSNVGRRLDTTTSREAASIFRSLRAASFVANMSQSGFAQVPEAGSVLAGNGIVPFLQQLPTIAKMLRSAQDGKLGFDNELLQSIAANSAIFNEYQTRRVIDGIDFEGDLLESVSTGKRALDKTQNFLNKAERVASVASGLSTTDTLLVRSAMTTNQQKWFNIARSNLKRKPGQPLKLPSEKRLFRDGLDIPQATKIVEMINKYAKWEPTMMGPRIGNMNVEQWINSGAEGAEAASAFVISMEKNARRLVLRGDLGTEFMWMHKEWARNLVQFRSFSINAYETMLLSNAQIHDFESLNMVLMTSFFAAITYTAQTYFNSIGREDQKEYIAERVTWDKVGKAAFYRAGYSSLLPTIIDTGANFLGIDPIFAHSRSSQLATDAITGNPTIAGFNIVQQGIGSVVGPALFEKNNFTQSDWDKARRLAWIDRYVGLNQVANALRRNFTEKEPRK